MWTETDFIFLLNPSTKLSLTKKRKRTLFPLFENLLSGNLLAHTLPIFPLLEKQSWVGGRKISRVEQNKIEARWRFLFFLIIVLHSRNGVCFLPIHFVHPAVLAVGGGRDLVNFSIAAAALLSFQPGSPAEGKLGTPEQNERGCKDPGVKRTGNVKCCLCRKRAICLSFSRAVPKSGKGKAG